VTIVRGGGDAGWYEVGNDEEHGGEYSIIHKRTLTTLEERQKVQFASGESNAMTNDQKNQEDAMMKKGEEIYKPRKRKQLT